MATAFKVNTPVSTRENFVDVQNDLAPGTHVFQLEVVDNQGNRSAPVKARVVITDPTRGPGPVIGPVINPGPIVRPGPIL